MRKMLIVSVLMMFGCGFDGQGNMACGAQPSRWRPPEEPAASTPAGPSAKESEMQKGMNPYCSQKCGMSGNVPDDPAMLACIGECIEEWTQWARAKGILTDE